MATGTQVASLYGLVDVEDKATGKLKGVGGALSGLATQFAAFGVAGFLAGAVKEAAEEQKNIAQLDAVLRSTANVAGVTRQAALDLANAFQRTTRFGNDTVLAAENILLTFTQIGKDVFPDATEAVLNMSQALGQDTKNSAIQLGKALNDPILGVTALRRVGVMLTATQEQQIRNFMRLGQVSKAQAVILRELNTEFGGSAVAAGQTFAGSLDILRNAVSDIMKRIGNALIPTLHSLTTFLTGLAQGIGDVDPTLVQLAALFTGIVIAAGPIGAILGAILSPLGAIAIAVGGLALAWTNDWGGIRTTISEAFSFIQPTLDELVKAVQRFFEALRGPEVPDLSQTIGAALQGAMEKLPDIRLDTGKKLKLTDLPPGTGKEMLDAFLAPFQDFGTKVAERAKFDSIPFGTRISKAIAASAPEIEAAIGELGYKIADALGRALGDALDAKIKEDMSLVASGKWLESVVIDPSIGAAFESKMKTALVSGDWSSLQGDLISKTQGILIGMITGAGNKEMASTLQGTLQAFFMDVFSNIDLGQASLDFVGVAVDGIQKFWDWFEKDGKAIFQAVSQAIGLALSSGLGQVASAIKGAVVQGLQAIVVILAKMGSLPFIGPTATALAKQLVDAMGMQSGGSVGKGRPYIVGEAGPELFVPGANGAIVPNRALTASGAGSVVISLNAYGVNDPARLVNMVDQELKRRGISQIGNRRGATA